VQEADIILVQTPESTLTYQVQWSVVVEPRRVDLLDSTDARTLTLVTCFPFEFVGRAPRRFVVRALQIETPVGLSAASPEEAPGSDSGPGQ
jgi:sortase A